MNYQLIIRMNNTSFNQTTTTTPSLEIKIIYITHFVVITLIILFTCASVIVESDD